MYLYIKKCITCVYTHLYYTPSTQRSFLLHMNVCVVHIHVLRYCYSDVCMCVHNNTCTHTFICAHVHTYYIVHVCSTCTVAKLVLLLHVVASFLSFIYDDSSFYNSWFFCLQFPFLLRRSMTNVFCLLPPIVPSPIPVHFFVLSCCIQSQKNL